MMKVSDPIIFGHVVKAYFADVFDKYGDDLAAAGLSANDGLGAILAGLPALPNGAEIEAAFEAALASGPRLSYVNSDKGITNLHVPSDVIVDASMPALIRNGGKLWGVDGGRGRHPRGHPRFLLLGGLRDRHRGREEERAARPGDDRHRPQRRPDGAGGGGVRLAQQDLRDPRRRHRHHRQPGRPGAARPRRRGRRHLARLPDQGHPGPRLGEARRHPGPRRADPGRSSGSTRPARTTPS